MDEELEEFGRQRSSNEIVISAVGLKEWGRRWQKQRLIGHDDWKTCWNSKGACSHLTGWVAGLLLLLLLSDDSSAGSKNSTGLTDQALLNLCSAKNVLTMRHVLSITDSGIKRDQLDVTCFIISLFNAQHVSDVNTSILRNWRLICWVISWVVLLWFDVCWCYVVVWLWWCGIRMQAEALVPQPANGYHTTTAKPQRNTNLHRTRAIQPMK